MLDAWITHYLFNTTQLLVSCTTITTTLAALNIQYVLPGGLVDVAAAATSLCRCMLAVVIIVAALHFVRAQVFPCPSSFLSIILLFYSFSGILFFWFRHTVLIVVQH